MGDHADAAELPRVSDADIKTLVRFILGLSK